MGQKVKLSDLNFERVGMNLPSFKLKSNNTKKTQKSSSSNEDEFEIKNRVMVFGEEEKKREHESKSNSFEEKESSKTLKCSRGDKSSERLALNLLFN